MTRIAFAFAAFIGLLIVLADTRNLGPLYAVYDFPYGDKAGHIALYGMLTLVANLAVVQRRARTSPASVALVSSVVLVLVSLEELSQLMFPARTVDWYDLVASYIGVGYFTCLSLFIVEWRRSNIAVAPMRQMKG